MAKRKNKKGSLIDLIGIGTALLAVAIVVLIGFKVSDEINTEFQANDNIPTAGKTAYSTINDYFPTVMDNTFLFLLIGLSIVALVLASLVRVHPVFFVLYLVMLVIIIFLSGIFSNIYLEIAGNAEFSAYADQLIFITHIMHFLPFIIGIVGFILSIIMYKNWSEGL